MPPITVSFGPSRLLFGATPQWLSTPTPLFNEGAGVQNYVVTSSHVTDADISAGDVVTITYVGGALGSGVTFVPGPIGVAKYQYSGVGSSSISGAQLLATDSAVPSHSALSSVHTITIVPAVVEPPPVPATGTALATIGLMSTVGGTVPFSFGQVFAKGHIAFGNEAVLDDNGSVFSQQQCTILSTWPDSSVRHAVVAGRVALTVNVQKVLTIRARAVTSGTALTRSALQTILAGAGTTSVNFGAYGVSTLPNVSTTAPDRTYITGPQMCEWHWYVPASINAALGAWFHVRLFAGTPDRVWIRIIAGNKNFSTGTYNSASLNKSYVPTATIGGTVVWNNSGASLTHLLYSGWEVTGWVGGDPAITPVHDTMYLRRTKMVPWFQTDQELPSDASLLSMWPNGLQRKPYDELDELKTAWDGTLTQQYKGILPGWEAAFIMKGAPTALWPLIYEQSRRFGNYCWCHENPTATAQTIAHTPLRLVDAPTATYQTDQGGVQFSYGDVATYVAVTPNKTPNNADWTGPFPPKSGWDLARNDHGPYLAWLLTGERYFFDTLFSVATACIWTSTPNNRGGGQGYGNDGGLSGIWLSNGQRDLAWTSKLLFQAAASGPNGDPLTIEAARMAGNQIDYIHTRHIGTSAPWYHPLGFIGKGNSYVDDYGPGSHTGPWMQDFVIQTWAYGKLLEPSVSSAQLTKLGAVVDHIALTAVNRTGVGADTTKWPLRYGICYPLRVAENTRPVYEELLNMNPVASPDVYTSWSTIYTKSVEAAVSMGNTGWPAIGTFPSSVALGEWWNGPSNTISNYGNSEQRGNFVSAVMQAANAGVPNASSAATRIRSVTNWATIQSGSNATGSGLNLNFRVGVAESQPDWLVAMNMAEGDARPIPITNTFLSVDPGGPNWNNIYNYNDGGILKSNVNIFTGYGGGAVPAENYGRHGGVALHGGGHGDYGGNESYVLDYSYPKYIRLDNPSTSADIDDLVNHSGWGETLDGQPFSMHTYDQLLVLPPGNGGGPQGSLVRVNGTAIGPAGDDVTGTHAFDLSNPSPRWKRFSSALNSNLTIGRGPTLLDTFRNRIWYFPINGARASYLDLNSNNTWNLIPALSPGLDGVSGGNTADHGFGYYIPGRDLAVVFTRTNAQDRIAVRYISLASPTGFVQAQLSLTIPNSYSFGFAWVPPISKFVGFTKAQTDRVYEITIPPNLSSTWPVEEKLFSGSYNPSSVLAGATSMVGKRWMWSGRLNRIVMIGHGGYNSGIGATPLVYRPYGVAQ